MPVSVQDVKTAKATINSYKDYSLPNDDEITKYITKCPGCTVHKVIESIATSKQWYMGGGKTRSKITPRKETVQEIKEDEKIISSIQKTLIVVLFVGVRTNNSHIYNNVEIA